MDVKLFTQIESWNPWWKLGKDGMKKFNDPCYKRELYFKITKRLKEGNEIISIVGMRQVGKSTLMRQIIKELLEAGVNSRRIFYISFDDPYLKTQYEPKKIFDLIINTYTEAIFDLPIEKCEEQLYLFLDEIHQLPNWEKYLKSYYDRAFPIKFVVSGSSSIHLQQKNKESLLGRISEHTLWPFSFKEYVEYKTNNAKFKKVISDVRIENQDFCYNFNVEKSFKNTRKGFKELQLWHKQNIDNYLKQYIISGGFPRAWQHQDFISRQRFLWEQHIDKVIFEDLVQTINIRKPKDLQFLFIRLIDFNCMEVKVSQIAQDLRINRITLDRYLSYLIKTFLLFRVERTKTKRIALKRRSGNIKFYLTDVALRNALYKKDEDVINDEKEMSFIAENLVCTAIQRWLINPRREEQINFYKDRSGEVDFVVKNHNDVLPIEVKWRNDIKSLKTLDKVSDKWGSKYSIIVTKNFDFTFRNGRLSIPLWFFLLIF